MRIGELASRTGVSVRSIRYYEQMGLVLGTRKPGAWRSFTVADVERVIQIQGMFAAGLNSAKIGEVLRLDSRPSACRILDELLEAEREKLVRNVRHAEDELRNFDELRESLERQIYSTDTDSPVGAPELACSPGVRWHGEPPTSGGRRRTRSTETSSETSTQTWRDT